MKHTPNLGNGINRVVPPDALYTPAAFSGPISYLGNNIYPAFYSTVIAGTDLVFTTSPDSPSTGQIYVRRYSGNDILDWSAPTNPGYGRCMMLSADQVLVWTAQSINSSQFSCSIHVKAVSDGGNVASYPNLINIPNASVASYGHYVGMGMLPDGNVYYLFVENSLLLTLIKFDSTNNYQATLTTIPTYHRAIVIGHYAWQLSQDETFLYSSLVVPYQGGSPYIVRIELADTQQMTILPVGKSRLPGISRLISTYGGHPIHKTFDTSGNPYAVALSSGGSGYTCWPLAQFENFLTELMPYHEGVTQ